MTVWSQEHIMSFQKLVKWPNETEKKMLLTEFEHWTLMFKNVYNACTIMAIMTTVIARVHFKLYTIKLFFIDITRKLYMKNYLLFLSSTHLKVNFNIHVIFLAFHCTFKVCYSSCLKANENFLANFLWNFWSKFPASITVL